MHSSVAGPAFAQVPLAVAASALDSIASVARARGFSLEDALLAAFEVLLTRYSGEDLVAGGLPAAVVWTDLSGDPTFSEVLARVPAVRDAHDRRQRPLEQLWDFVGPGRAAGSAPCVPYLLVLGDDPGNEVAPYELKVRLGGIDAGGIEYDRRRFAPETATGIADHFRLLLEGIATDPDRPVSQLPLVGEGERRLLVDGWNDTGLDLPPVCIHHLVEEQAARDPDALAVGDRHGWVSYRELNQRANQLAHHLRGLGIGLESLVAICLRRTSAMVVAMLGVLKAGGAYVPLDPEYPAQRLAFMLGDAATSVLITESALLDSLPPHSARVVSLDRDAPQLAAESHVNPAAGSGPGNLAYVVYTSGSTGRPKGVTVEHRSVVSLVSWARDTYSLQELERVLASTSMCFDLSVFEIFVPLAAGTSLFVAPDLLNTEWAKSAPTLINTVPSVLAAVLRDRNLPDSVVTVNLAGETLGRDLVEATLEKSRAQRVLNLYGPSEATVYATAAVMGGGAAAGDRVPIGRPVANTEVYLTDALGELVPRGAIGEIRIGGAGLARGYLNHPELTAERFVDHAFRPGERLYRTGDLGRYRSDGTIDFFGRMDDQIKIRGFRIEPGEVEVALLAHPGVAQAAVIVREDAPGPRQLVGYLVAPAGAAPPTSRELRAHLAGFLPDHMIPATFVHLEALPRNPSGKLDRPALPVPEMGRPAGGGQWEPRTDAEVTLAQIWADVLKVPKVGLDDDFFELGGHSLLAAEVVTRIQQVFGRKLPVTLLLQAATIRAAAATLEAEDPTQVWRSVFPIHPFGTNRPLFCLHGLAGNVTGYRPMLPYLGPDQPLYGIQSVGLDGERPPYTRVEDMAAHYISQIQAIQSEGPYLLAGICFGSLVAYEIAYQLASRHHAEVALLALVDPTPLPTRTFSEQRRRRMTKLHRLPWGDRASFLVETGGILVEGARAAAWSVVVNQRLRQHRPVPRRARAMEAVNSKATAAYTPPPYSGPIVLYRSEGLATEDDNARGLAWASLSGPNIDVVDIIGASHESLFVEPHIRVVAEHLRESIDRALATSRTVDPGVSGG